MGLKLYNKIQNSHMWKCPFESNQYVVSFGRSRQCREDWGKEGRAYVSTDWNSGVPGSGLSIQPAPRRYSVISPLYNCSLGSFPRPVVHNLNLTLNVQSRLEEWKKPFCRQDETPGFNPVSAHGHGYSSEDSCRIRRPSKSEAEPVEREEATLPLRDEKPQVRFMHNKSSASAFAFDSRRETAKIPGVRQFAARMESPSPWALPKSAHPGHVRWTEAPVSVIRRRAMSEVGREGAQGPEFESCPRFLASLLVDSRRGWKAVYENQMKYADNLSAVKDRYSMPMPCLLQRTLMMIT